MDNCARGVKLLKLIFLEGSITSYNWNSTMHNIAKFWINDMIRPNGSPECGNHVAARWYSSNSARFLDFTPPPITHYQQFSKGYHLFKKLK